MVKRFVDRFDPTSEPTFRALCEADDRARGFEFIASRGDTHGVYVTAIPADAPLELRFPTLYKLAHCLEDGRPFEPWTDADVRDHVLPRLVDQVQTWRAEKHTDATTNVSYLRSAAAGAVSEIGHPRSPNSPHFVPNAADCMDLRRLEFVADEYVVAVLCNRWNQLDMVFERDATFHYVRWFTTA